MSTYNLNSNQAHRINFDQMVQQTLDEAMAAYGSVGSWDQYFDLDDLDVDNQDEAKARIEAIWPEARIDKIVRQMEFVSAGEGEVNENREEAALREWLANHDGEYTPELQAEWNEWVAENEPQYDESYD